MRSLPGRVTLWSALLLGVLVFPQRRATAQDVVLPPPVPQGLHGTVVVPKGVSITTIAVPVYITTGSPPRVTQRCTINLAGRVQSLRVQATVTIGLSDGVTFNIRQARVSIAQGDRPGTQQILVEPLEPSPAPK